MKEHNNFKQISEIHTPPQSARDNVRKNLVSMKFIGGLVDLYVIKPVGLFVHPKKNILKKKDRK